MENYYFPLFLVVTAVAVVVLFKWAGSANKSRRSRLPRTPAGRTAESGRLHRKLDRAGPAAGRRLPIADGPKDIWQKRREHKAHELESLGTSVKARARRKVHLAGYMGPYDDIQRRVYGSQELKDQNISKSEHLGIDEYLNKRELEKAEAEAEEAGGLSMTAMKYEPGDASSEEGKHTKKRAGFKP